MRVKVQQVAEGVHADDQAGLGSRLIEQDAEARDQHLGRHPAQIPEQPPVVAEIRPEHLGDRQHDLPVRHRPEHRLVHPLGEGHRPLGVTGGAEVTPLAGVGRQVLVAALPAAHPGEALLQVAAAEVLVDGLPDDGPQEPVAVLVALGVRLLEPLEVLLDEAVEGRLSGRRGR